MTLLITLLVYLAVLAVVWWIISQLPLPAPFGIVANVIIGVVAIIMLLSLVNGGLPVISLR